MMLISDEERAQGIVVEAEGWPFDRSKRTGFDVWLLNEEGSCDPIANETCCFADPQNGRFVFYWIRGHEIDFQSVRSCLVQFEGEEIRRDFHGLADGPRTCVTTQDHVTKRIYASFALVPEEVKQPSQEEGAVSAEDRSSVSALDKILDAIRTMVP